MASEAETYATVTNDPKNVQELTLYVSKTFYCLS